MSVWIPFFGLALVAALAIAVPLFRVRRPDVRRADFDLAVFRRQLDDLEVERERGVLSETEAAAARTEIERRILALGVAAPPGRVAAMRTRQGLTAALLVIAVPALSVSVYTVTGTPDAPDQPLVGRAAEPPPVMPGDIEQAIAALAARLAEDPDNLEGWMLLGRSYVFTERFADAAEAFALAAALAPGEDDVVTTYGEALTYAAGGVVTPAARQQFETVLARSPDHPGARYYRGLALLQGGDREGAFETWSALALSAEPNAPWLADLVGQLDRLAAELGVEGTEIAVTAPSRRESGAGPDAPGSDAEGLEPAARMTPEERAAMIDGMVARLEARLLDDPDDPEGWKRLGRAKRVLEDLAGARLAYARAVEQAPEDIDALGGLAEIERLLGDPVAPLPEGAVALYERVLEIDAQQADALWFLGLAAAQAGRNQEASDFWSRLLAMLPPGSDEHKLLSSRVSELDAVR